MPDANVSKRLQKTIVIYSALGMLAVGITVGLVGVLPLSKQLREAHENNLLVELQRRSAGVEQFLTRARNSSSSIASRGRTLDALHAYNRGELTRQQLVSSGLESLRERVQFSTNAAGLLLFDVRSNLLAQFGQSFPAEQRIWPEPDSREAVLSGPFRLNNETYLISSASMIGTNQGSGRAGIIMVLYRAQGLQAVIDDYAGLGKSGETVLGSRQNKKLPIFFPLREARGRKPPPPQRTETILEALRLASEKRTELFRPQAPFDNSLLIATGPIKGMDWGMAIVVNRSELFAGMNRKIQVLGLVLAILTLLGGLGMVVVMRPLTGRVLLHTDELESQIYEKTAALNTELSERKRAEQSLRDSEALYHSLVDTLPISIIRKDLNGRVTYGNRGYCERMGRPLAELMGKSDYELFPKDLAEKYCNDDEKVVRSGEIFEGIEEHRAKDGTKSFVHVLKAPVRDARNLVVGTQVIFWDVTARKLAEEALERAAAELARSNKELEQFAYVASHDLQEPLRMITSYTQLIAKRYHEKLDQDARDFMHFAVDGAMRMQKLIQGLLEYSRVGSRGKPLEPTDTGNALGGAMANLRIAIEESRAKVTHDALPTLMADPIQLTQLFQNLIGNALKFRGEAPPAIHVSAERRARPESGAPNAPAEEWVFHVRDNGIGIEPQYFERIFVIFQRLHTQDRYPGTGIGLAICRKIVERHGGRIWLESKPGEGTCFHFTLPAATASTASTATAVAG